MKMNDAKVAELWEQSKNDAEGMRLGYTTQQHYFAALVRADEREACAKVCDEVDKESQSQWPKRLATMIRARGST